MDAKSAENESKAAVEGLEPSCSSGEGASDIFIDPVLEQRAMRKFDCWMLPQLAIVTLISYLDRSNIGELLQSGTWPVYFGTHSSST